MSYDLAVFDPRAELRDRETFLAWFQERTEWGEQGYDYDDPAHATPALRAWLLEMIQTFPAMNGPLAYRGEDDDVLEKATDYSIAHDLIYVAFAWSQAEDGADACINLAEKYGVGFFNAGGEGEAFFPDEDGKLTFVHGGSRG